MCFKGSKNVQVVVLMHVDRGSFCFGARFYLGAFLMYFFFFGSWCIYLDVFFFFMGCICYGETLCFFISFIVSCFTCVTLAIDLYYEVIHDICLLFSVLWNQEFILFLLVLSTRAFMCLLSVTGIYRLIQSCYCLYWQLIDSS